MIVDDASPIDSSDAVSTITFVDIQKVPRGLPTLVICSLVASTLAFTYATVDSVNPAHQKLSRAFVPTGLAYIFSLLYHIAVLLLKWLEWHKRESIMSFSPSAPRSIVYSILLTTLWAASAVVCSINLHRATNLKLEWVWNCIYPINSSYCYPTVQTLYRPSIETYATPLASTLTSSMALIVSLSITSLSYINHYRLRKTP